MAKIIELEQLENIYLVFIFDFYLTINKQIIDSYLPTPPHKVNFLAEFNRFEFRVFLFLDNIFTNPSAQAGYDTRSIF